ncbi:neutral zinc metallopeptidase [Dactylosporangium vinaceum]|uniref:Neutral zinc metallopeptidase n=1 Tax=Dactylosporangium vinaceum TaxID=53362 RepID=A0ABV5M0H2_9ACTN|nr:neutral zinc metallopeptidase [Dactylosporangium vinaceum]UAB97397.1 neutral zinc metallopeptidase [Dactylosporangium vinaceum]
MLVALTLTACDPVNAGTEPGGNASSAGKPSAANGTPTGRPPSPSAAAANSAVPKSYEHDLDVAFATVVEFWKERFAEDGRTFRPVSRIVPYTSGNGPKCGQEKLGARNAAYCGGGPNDFIGYDTAWLRTQWQQIGDTFVYFLVGHEYAHAAQLQLDLSSSYTIQHELQADCFAGAYLGTSVDEHRLTLDDGDLEELFNGIATVGDGEGVGWLDAGAHGAALERRAAFFAGYFTSAGTCTTKF